MATPDPGQESDSPAARFDAVLAPHRSLSPRGFLVLMSAVGAVGFVTGIVFLLLGAWPVMGFCGLDVLLIYIAFKLNYRAARLHETVRLTAETLELRRIQPSGAAQSWQFNPYWVRLVVGNDPQTERSTLSLRSHGREVVFAEFLPEEEKIDFARALRSALAEARGAEPGTR